MTDSMPASHSGRWFIRDWYWTAVGLIVIDHFRPYVVESSGTALKVEIAVIVVLAFVLARFLPLTGAVVPCRPGHRSGKCPDPEALAFAKSRAWLYFILVGAGTVLYRLGDAVNVAMIGITVVILLAPRIRGPRIRHHDVAWAALGAAAVFLYFDRGDGHDLRRNLGLIALAAGIVVLLHVAGERPHRAVGRVFHFVGVHLVRTLAALAGAAAAYGVVNALVAAPFIVLATIALSLLAAVLLAFAVAGGDARWLPGSLAARIAIGVAVLVVGWPVTAAIGVGALWGSGVLEHQLNESGVRNRDTHPRGIPPRVDPSDGWANALAYEPFIARTTDEPWRPTSADDYLATAEVLGGAPTPQPATSIATPQSDAFRLCSGEKSGPVCRITIHCPDADAACANDQDGVHDALYARVIDEKHLDIAKVPGVGHIRWLIQYWIFYRYDDWYAWVGKGFHQWHEADWELVSVGLGENGPLFAAFSAHCGGVWTPWRKIAGVRDRGRTRDGHLVPGTAHGHHVVAFVARGSHASYPTAAVQAPDWNSCANKVPVSIEAATWGPTRAAGLREHMKYGPRSGYLGPPLTRLTEAEPAKDGASGKPADPPWLAYRGRWGLHDHFRYLWSGGVCPENDPASKCGPGPDAPPRQPSWSKPVWWIFCSKHFQPKGKCPLPPDQPDAVHRLTAPQKTPDPKK
jgi:hypothetical protein